MSRNAERLKRLSLDNLVGRDFSSGTIAGVHLLAFIGHREIETSGHSAFDVHEIRLLASAAKLDSGDGRLREFCGKSVEINRALIIRIKRKANIPVKLIQLNIAELIGILRRSRTFAFNSCGSKPRLSVLHFYNVSFLISAVVIEIESFRSLSEKAVEHAGKGVLFIC